MWQTDKCRGVKSAKYVLQLSKRIKVVSDKNSFIRGSEKLNVYNFMCFTT